MYESLLNVVLGLVDVRSHGDDARNTVGIRLGGAGRLQGMCQFYKSTTKALRKLTGVCMIEILEFLRKSADPPSPFSILLPLTQVELAWP